MILFDLPIYQLIISTFGLSPNMITAMRLITTLGSTIVIITGILCTAVLFKDKKYFKTFVIANALGVVLNNIIKIIVRRKRPENTFIFTNETTYSFPSGHSMMSMIFYGLLIYYVCKFVKNKKLKVLLVSILSLIILLVGISRIYLGVHYATDVLGGYLFGIVYLILFIKIGKKSQKWT